MSNSRANSINKKILSELYSDSTKDPETVADSIGVPETEYRNQLKELDQSGIIKQYTAVPDPGKLGFPVPSYHFMSLAQNYDEAIKKGMPFFQAFGGSELAMVVLGEYDLVLRKLSSSDARLNNFMNNIINDPDYPKYDKSETYRVTERMRWRGFDIPETDRYEVTQVELTEIEQQTLKILRRNARLRTKPHEIAQRIGASTEEVTDAIDHLEDDVILGYSIDIDYDQLGWHRAWLGLSSLRGGYEEAIKSVKDINPLNVQCIVSGSGFNWAHIGVELVVDSLTELDEVTDKIRRSGSARETRTFLSTKSLVEDRVSID